MGFANTREKPKKEFEEKLLEVRRVTRVTTWWRRMTFRACILVWNKKWKIGVWVAKWVDVAIAVKKATNEAYKSVFLVPINDNWSVPYSLYTKYKSAIIKLIPAAQGTWLKAGSTVRAVLELAGYQNILSKIVWTNNRLNNALTTIRALVSYKKSKSSVRVAETNTDTTGAVVS